MTNNSFNIEAAYQDSLNFTKSHYENFPVVSSFVEKDLVKHVAVFYRFARQADDIADEGNKSPEKRLIELLEYENHLKRALINDFENDYWAAIKNTIDKYDLSTENFLNLLRAFKQDVIKSRYENYTELLDYCSRSANPVGRTILELNGINDETALKFSDSICTALQLTNFYQDISIDLKKNRVYLPQDELKEFGISDVHFNGEAVNENLREFLKFQVERTEALFLNGRKLIQYLSGKLKYQIMWTILGGETILAKIRKIDYDTPNFRPTLSKFDYIRLMIKSVFIKK